MKGKHSGVQKNIGHETLCFFAPYGVHSINLVVNYADLCSNKTVFFFKYYKKCAISFLFSLITGKYCRSM